LIKLDFLAWKMLPLIYTEWESVTKTKDRWRPEMMMATCDNCGKEFLPQKSWQRFHSPKCRDDWHYHQKKLAQVEEAEELRELRLNGANGNGAGNGAEVKPLSEIIEALRPSAPKPPLLRRM
jgi:predicted Zn-ribbon and HTH transcriptional regulator